ncbi:MAG TPA: hypothetical protein VKC59_05115 [Candidatus Limnocylindrales bacterium]|nr:hypothetical protein [Candidatus Limnocylindrales bacterium]
MNSDRDFDRLLDEWFAEGPREAADRVVVKVADRIERQSQRPAWHLPWRDSQVNLKLQWIAAAAVLVVAVFAATRLLGPAPNSGAGGPSSVPSSSPSSSASANPNVVHAINFGVPLTLTLSGGWTYGLSEPTNLELFWNGQNVDLGFHPLNKVTLPGVTVADPWIPVPADFVAWVQQRPEYTAFQTRPVTVGGRSGTEIDAAFVWNTGTTKRDFLRYTTGAWLYDQGDQGHRIRFIIVPGLSNDGFLIVVNAPAADFDGAVAALDGVLASVQFDAPTPSPSN